MQIMVLSIAEETRSNMYDGGLAPDPEGIITVGHGNQTGRMIAIHDGEPINRPALTSMFKAIIADHRAGGWRRPKAGS
jgi:hypothetical protein